MSLSLATKGVINGDPALGLATKGMIAKGFGAIVATLGLILNPSIVSVTLRRLIVHLPFEIKPYP